MQKQRLGFQPFDQCRDVRIYSHGFLPHWRQDGCTYFVTFRLADSVPQAVLNEWAYERRCWMRARGLDLDDLLWKEAFARLNELDQRQFARHFGTKLNEYLDRGYGSCVLRDESCARIVAKALDYFHESRLETGDFVVMPNHAHALMTPYPGYELEDILWSIKSYTATMINRHNGMGGALWMRESYDHIVRDGEELLRFQGYIRANPTKAGLRVSECIVSRTEYLIRD